MMISVFEGHASVYGGFILPDSKLRRPPVNLVFECRELQIKAIDVTFSNEITHFLQNERLPDLNSGAQKKDDYF